jgi:hypothetical protein
LKYLFQISFSLFVVFKLLQNARVRFFGGQQGDQMSLSRISPKCCPTRLLIKIYTALFPRKKDTKNVGYLCNFQKFCPFVNNRPIISTNLVTLAVAGPFIFVRYKKSSRAAAASPQQEKNW